MYPLHESKTYTEQNHFAKWLIGSVLSRSPPVSLRGCLSLNKISYHKPPWFLRMHSLLSGFHTTFAWQAGSESISLYHGEVLSHNHLASPRLVQIDVTTALGLDFFLGPSNRPRVPSFCFTEEGQGPHGTSTQAAPERWRRRWQRRKGTGCPHLRPLPSLCAPSHFFLP